MVVDTYPTSSNETDFLSWNSGTGDCGSFTDMLMVTSTVRMVNWVHSDTTSARPAGRVLFDKEKEGKIERDVLVPLSFVFVICTTGLEQRLVDTTTAGYDTNSGACTSRDSFLCTTW